MTIKVFFLAVFYFLSFENRAQLTPQPSPMASWSQTVGITKLSMEYSRPAVRGRVIFGGLLPYGRIWRTGANNPTLFYTSNAIRIEGQLLEAGEYAVLSFPGKTSWEIIFSKNLESTEQNYDPTDDILRVSVKTSPYEFTESFTIDISAIHNDGAQLNFYWEKTKTSLDLEVYNEKTVVEALEQRSIETAGAFLQAAEYFVNQNLDLEKALDYAEQSIRLKETFRNTWIKSVILRKLNRNKEALDLAIKAKELGENDPVYGFFEEAIKDAIIDLKLLSPQRD